MHLANWRNACWRRRRSRWVDSILRTVVALLVNPFRKAIYFFVRIRDTQRLFISPQTHTDGQQRAIQPYRMPLGVRGVHRAAYGSTERNEHCILSEIYRSQAVCVCAVPVQAEHALLCSYTISKRLEIGWIWTWEGKEHDLHSFVFGFN